MTSVPDKDAVARNWRIRAKPWNKWAPTLEKMAARFNEPLLDAAGIAPGQAVLDLASGVGEPALTIARRVGPEGRVVATDMVSEMLAGTERRAREAGLDNVTCQVADMEALAFDDGSFDRVTCRFGIMFVPDPAKALAETFRVLKPGGRTAWMVWGPLENTTLFSVIQKTVREVLDLPPAPDLPQFRFAPAGMLQNGLAGAGFEAVEETDLKFDANPPAGSRFWEANMEMSFAEEFQAISSEQRAEVDRRVAEAFDAYLDGDRYRVKAHVRIGVGTRPA